MYRQEYLEPDKEQQGTEGGKKQRIIRPLQGVDQPEDKPPSEKEKEWQQRIALQGMRPFGSAVRAGLTGQADPVVLDYCTALFARQLPTFPVLNHFGPDQESSRESMPSKWAISPQLNKFHPFVFFSIRLREQLSRTKLRSASRGILRT